MMSRTSRLFELIAILRARRLPVTAFDLSGELGVSQRSIYRDMETLRALGAPIEGEAGVGFSLRNGFFLPQFAFSPDELDALALGLGWVQQRADPALAKSSESALAKILAARINSASTGDGTPALAPAAPVSERVDPPQAALLRDAIRRQRKVQIRYEDARGAGPIMPNAGGAGYYRFALDDTEWQSLIASAATLPPGEALAATDSLWAGFDAGDVPARLLVAEARAMLANPYSKAAADPGNRFRTLVKRGLIDDSALLAYRHMIDGLYGPKLAAMGFDPAAGAYPRDDADQRQMRAQLIRLVGLDAADPTVEKRLADAAGAWLAGDTHALDKTETPNAFAAYVAIGGLPAAQAIFERALTGDDPYFRAVAMDTIGRSGDPAIAQWLIDHLDDNRLRASERTRSVRLLMADAATRDIGYRALVARFDQLSKGIFNGASSLLSAPDNFCSADAAAMIERDIRPKIAQYRISPLDLDRTIEKVRDCGELKQAKAGELASAFATN
jgi:biotin operon repressor